MSACLKRKGEESIDWIDSLSSGREGTYNFVYGAAIFHPTVIFYPNNFSCQEHYLHRSSITVEDERRCQRW